MTLKKGGRSSLLAPTMVRMSAVAIFLTGLDDVLVPDHTQQMTIKIHNGNGKQQSLTEEFHNLLSRILTDEWPTDRDASPIAGVHRVRSIRGLEPRVSRLTFDGDPQCRDHGYLSGALLRT